MKIDSIEITFYALEIRPTISSQRLNNAVQQDIASPAGFTALEISVRNVTSAKPFSRYDPRCEEPTYKTLT